MAVVWLEQYHRTSRVTAPMGSASAGESGQRTALSTPNNAICNGRPYDAAGEDLSRRYYAPRTAVAVVPRKPAVLPEVMLRPP